MITYVCSYCQSEDIKKDAYAVWNKEKQEWELDAIFDKGSVCEDCGGETSLIEINGIEIIL